MITKCIKLTVLFVFLFHLLSIPVKAEIKSYLITNGFFEPFPTRVNGFVYFYTYIGMIYKSGTVVLSSSPDGTGNITVGDMLDVNMTYPHQGQLQLKGYSNNCLSFQDIYPPQDITHFFKSYLNNGIHSTLVRLQHWCLRPKTIGSLYLVNIIPDPTPTPTPSPTPTATPIPTPVPFLELPWDYQSKGMTFIDAALSMSSHFDHEYPLLSGGTDEPSDALATIISYQKNQRNNKLNYSSHDGYDYASNAKVKLGDSVLAVASGTARYVSSCSSCGNMILIDHGNGYQTRYLHLQKDGLITTNSAETVAVSARQPIGKVGFTGHVIPPGKDGAHIHISVFQDKNKNGSFDDNIPDGVTDPFGWNSTEPDPWEHYTFNYFGTQKTGNKSYYLWKHPIQETKGEISPEGGAFTTHKGTVMFPAGATDKLLDLNFGVTPVGDPGASLISVGAGYDVKAYDSIGNLVTNFLQPFHFVIDFLSYDLSNIKPETLSIYSSQDGTTWKKEQTTVDMAGKKATAEIDHLTQFALMGERLDTVAPITTASLNGLQGEENHFRSDVTVSLSAVDNEGGLGVEYTAIKVHTPDTDEDWNTYSEPLIFSSEGEYIIEYYSVDNDANSEEAKTLIFSIDKTIPEAEIVYDLDRYDLMVTAHDRSQEAQVVKTDLGKNKERIVIADKAGNTLTILDKDREKGKKAIMNIYSLQYNSDSPIELEDNKLVVTATYDKMNNLKSFNQLFQVKGEKKLELTYNEKKDKTKVIIRVKGQDKEKAELDGITMLKLSTNKGLLIEKY